VPGEERKNDVALESPNWREKIPEKEKIIRVHSRDSRAELPPATP
jgi:hypothetical protein